MLVVDNVNCRYGSIQALHEISLRVDAREVVAVVGSNGAGKSTLLRAISGLLPAAAGAIRFGGEDIGRWPVHERVSRGIVLVPEGRRLFAPLSVEDNLRLGAWCRRDGDIGSDMEGVYASFPILAERRRAVAGTLSGGEQQMLAIGRALMAKPKLMLLDEPSIGLAPMVVDEVFAMIGGLKRRGIAVLVVEQNAFAALSVADRGYALETGQVALTGTGQDLLADPRVRSAYLGV